MSTTRSRRSRGRRRTGSRYRNGERPRHRPGRRSPPRSAAGRPRGAPPVRTRARPHRRSRVPATVIASGGTGRQKRKGKAVWIQPSMRWPSFSLIMISRSRPGASGWPPCRWPAAAANAGGPSAAEGRCRRRRRLRHRRSARAPTPTRGLARGVSLGVRRAQPLPPPRARRRSSSSPTHRAATRGSPRRRSTRSSHVGAGADDRNAGVPPILDPSLRSPSTRRNGAARGASGSNPAWKSGVTGKLGRRRLAAPAKIRPSGSTIAASANR